MTNTFYPLMCWLYSTPLELLLNNSFINERFGILRRLGYKTMNKEENVAAMVLPVRYKQQQLTAHAYKLCGWESVCGGGGVISIKDLSFPKISKIIGELEQIILVLFNFFDYFN